MEKKSKTTGTVVSQREIAPGIYDMRLETALAREGAAGQFVGVYPRNRATLLPRPLSICEADRERERLRLVYRIAGSGTKEFAAYRAGETVSLLGVLGNGFPVREADGKRVFLLGGGIGIPPLVQLAAEIKDRNKAHELHIVLGYRDSHLFLKEDLETRGILHVATEDGSAGTPGNCLDALRDCKVQPEVIMACGPMPMLRAIKAYAAEARINAFISLEERMACGVGVCLGCVCKHKENEHRPVNMARICTEGPVFAAAEVEI